MADLHVDAGAVAAFAAALDAHADPVGTECAAAGQTLGSGVVHDALGNAALVLTVLDQTLADGAGALARDARHAAQAWTATDGGLVMRAV